MSDASLQIKPKTRRITEQDVAAMADLLAKRITETGACLILGLKPQTWFQFKGRAKNASKFEQVLAHAREAKLNATIDTIDKAGEPYDVVTKSGTVYQRPGDWRAKAFIVERVLAPERFGDRQQPANQTNLLIGDDTVNKVIALFAQSKQQQIEANTPPLKQLNDVKE